MDVSEFVVMIIAFIAMALGGASYLIPTKFGKHAGPSFVMSIALLALITSSSHISAVLCAQDKHDDDDECGSMSTGYWISMVILILSSVIVLLMLLTMTGLVKFIEGMPGGSKVKSMTDSIAGMRGGEVPPAFGKRGFRY